MEREADSWLRSESHERVWVRALKKGELVGVEEAARAFEGLQEVLGLDDGVVFAEATDLGRDMAL